MSASDSIPTQASRGEAQGFIARFAAIARRQSVIDGAARLLRVMTVVLAALLAIILLDAWMPMSAWVRGVLAIALLPGNETPFTVDGSKDGMNVPLPKAPSSSGIPPLRADNR